MPTLPGVPLLSEGTPAITDIYMRDTKKAEKIPPMQIIVDSRASEIDRRSSLLAEE
mgnify:CR=1 FL=1